MPSGDAFSASQQSRIDRSIRDAEIASRYEFSVFVGTADGNPRTYAQRLHSALVAPDRSVLVMVDPAARALEIVTGAVVRRDLSDDAVQLVAVTMQSMFAEGELVDGIQRGVALLAEAAHKPATLHAD